MPTFDGVRSARDAIAPHLAPTPLLRWPGIEALVGTAVWVKHENHLPTAAFKVRGGVNLAGRLSDEERAAGLIAASTGNHGQSVAYAARLFGVAARICVPQNANPVKVASIEALGAEVIAHGKDFDEAREHCEELARRNGYRYVNSGNEPLLIEGVGTHTLEILQAEPSVDVILVPIGGGSGAAGACIVATAVKPSVRVIGVQAEAAPSAYLSWRQRALIEDEMHTAAEGLATRVPFELPQKILWEHLSDFVLVSEDELKQATLLLIEHTRNLVEGAGAASLAAARKIREQLAGANVALICSGGNITPAQLRSLLCTT